MLSENWRLVWQIEHPQLPRNVTPTSLLGAPFGARWDAYIAGS